MILQTHESWLFVVRDDPELPDNSGKVPKPNGMDGSSSPCEIVSLLDEKIIRWSGAYCVPPKNKNDDSLLL